MKRIHYGWYVCLGCALLLFCTSGLCVNAFTIYQPYILNQNNFTNAQSSTIITVRSLFSFISMFLTGAYYKKISLRSGMTLAGLLTAAGFFLFGWAHTFAGYCLAAMVIGFGYGFGTMIPIAIVLEHWFIEKRTLAISLCSAITGLSTLGIPSALTWMIETYSMQTTFYIEGLFIALLALLVFLLVRDTPGQMNLTPYGAGGTAQAVAAPTGQHCLQRKNWYLLFPVLLLIGAMTNVGYSHLTVLSSSNGLGGHTIALGITISGVAMTVSKCIFGWVSERIGTYKTNWIFGSILLTGVFLCCIMGSNRALFFTAMFFYGTGLATTTVGLTAWAGDLSSPQQYDNTVRLFQIGYTAGGLIFSSLPGFVADHCNGSYVPSYAFFLLCTVFVLFSIQRTYRQVTQK